MSKHLQSNASFGLMQKPRHEAILLQLQPSGQSMPLARHLASCIQQGRFVEDESNCSYLKFNYNIASCQKPPVWNYFLKKHLSIILQIFVGLIIILEFEGSQAFFFC